VSLWSMLLHSLPVLIYFVAGASVWCEMLRGRDEEMRKKQSDLFQFIFMERSSSSNCS
jgi:hypothetical protein